MDRQKWMLSTYRKCESYGRKKFKGDKNQAQDFAGWVVTTRRSGSKIQCRTALVDYFRATLGDSRTKLHNDRKISQSVRDRNAEEERHRYDALEAEVFNGFDIGSDIDARNFRNAFEKRLTNAEKLILYLTENGYLLKEIGDLFGVSEGRISQILNEQKTYFLKINLREKKADIAYLEKQVQNLSWKFRPWKI